MPFLKKPGFFTRVGDFDSPCEDDDDDELLNSGLLTPRINFNGFLMAFPSSRGEDEPDDAGSADPTVKVRCNTSAVIKKEGD